MAERSRPLRGRKNPEKSGRTGDARSTPRGRLSLLCQQAKNASYGPRYRTRRSNPPEQTRAREMLPRAQTWTRQTSQEDSEISRPYRDVSIAHSKPGLAHGVMLYGAMQLKDFLVDIEAGGPGSAGSERVCPVALGKAGRYPGVSLFSYETYASYELRLLVRTPFLYFSCLSMLFLYIHVRR